MWKKKTRKKLQYFTQKTLSLLNELTRSNGSLLYLRKQNKIELFSSVSLDNYVNDCVLDCFNEDKYFIDNNVSHNSVKSTLTVPISNNKKVIGVVQIFSNKKDKYTTIDTETAKGFSQILSIPLGFIIGTNRTFEIADLIEDLRKKDTYTGQVHSSKVASLSLAMAKEYENMYDTHIDSDKLFYGSLMHDIGKLGMPDSILKSSKRLEDHEFNLIKQHVTIGYYFLRSLGYDSNICDIVRCHHLKIGKKGYPMINRDPTLLARIVGFADAIEAITAKRRYHTKQHSVTDALDMISSDFKDDKELLDLCYSMHENDTIRYTLDRH